MLLAKQASKSIEKLFISFRHEVSYLTTIDDIINLTANGRALLESYYHHANNTIKAITRVSAEGKILYTFPHNDNVLGTDISFQPHVAQLLETKQPVVSDVFRAVQNYQAIAYHIPVFKNGEFDGSLAVLIPFDLIAQDYLETIRISENGYAWLISENGVEIYCPVPGHIGKNVYFTSSDFPSVLEVCKKMMKGEQGIGNYYYNAVAKLSGKPQLKQCAYYPIKLENTFWSICINTPEKEILATMTSLNTKLFILIAVFLVGGILYSYSFLKASLVLKEAKKRLFAENALRNSEKRFRELADLLPLIIFETDSNRKLTYLNNKAAEIIGYTMSDVDKGLIIETIIAKNDHKKLQDFLNSVLDSKDELPREFVALKKDQKSFPVIIYCNLILKNDQPIGVRGIILDISERKKHEIELEKSEEQFRNYVNNAPDGLIVCDPRGQIKDVNPAFCFNTGYTREELLTLNILNLIPQHEKKTVKQFQNALINSRRATSDFTYIKKDGSQGYWTADMVQLSDNRFLGFVKDITERKLLEDQFRQAQKMEAIGHLAGGIAHDFNNLLTVINGYSEMILNFKKKDNLDENMQQILKAGQRAEALTRQLLAYSRKQLLQPKILNINHLLADVEQMLNRLIGEHIHLEIRYGKDISNIKADPGQLQQVILNLVVNSRDAMPNGGSLKIETENISVEKVSENTPGLKTGKFVLIKLSDTGFGMDKTTLNQIFDPFFTTKTEGKGTGLGLSTVYGIIKQSGGFIFVESTPNKGTLFKIYLKSVKDDLPTPSIVQPFNDKNTGEKHIFVIEDDRAVRDLTVKILTDYGFKATSAANGREAFELQHYFEKVDLLLTDVIMPGESGTDIARKIKEKFPDLPVLFMSGYSGETITQRGILDRTTHFIQKPYSPAKLLQKITEVLEAVKKA
ncbi:MAG: PAS domain S-box protein [Calditrichae bacterium]|nr:PAS domain S-box protein [Calditrichota bacterium]MCB9058769.1 PAS domain S-box protein [Calditrichia bacterium]